MYFTLIGVASAKRSLWQSRPSPLYPVGVAALSLKLTIPIYDKEGKIIFAPKDFIS